MWSGFVKSFSKDLGEFASVLTADTERLLEPGQGAKGTSIGKVTAGDETSPEATVFPLDDAAIDAFQCDVRTFNMPLTDDEENESHRLNASVCDADRLLASNETVRDQYAYLVTQKAESSPARATNQSDQGGDRSITHEEFFKRYFTRLLRLRRTASRNRRQQQASAGSDGQPLSEWDNSLSPSSGKATAVTNRSTAATGDETVDRAAYEKKIQDLERLVAALGSQVGHLQAENVRLQKELHAYRSGGDAGTTPDNKGAGSTGVHSAAKSDAAPLDDDDWATVS